MPIRKARRDEWYKVRNFCTNTFLWGDYIEQVWDSWTESGSLLAYEHDKEILGICNVVIYGTESWIEGIRVKPTARRRHIGISLLYAAEQTATQKGATHGRSGIESSNMASLQMYNTAKYRTEQVWHMYTCDAQPHNIQTLVYAAPKHTWPPRYVDSWMWLIPHHNMESGNILHLQDGPTFVLAESKRFKNTLMVTIHNNVQCNNNNNTIQYISDLAYRNNQTIQIFSTTKLNQTLLHKHDSTISIVVKKFP